MTEKTEKGKEGEEIAINYLIKQGYTILKQRFTSRNSEIDIICKKGKMLVFVEVRLKATAEYGQPEQSMGKAKQNAIKRGAEEYLNQNPWDGEARFDFIAIVQYPKFELTHFEDAFY